jgi:predicted secreted Zn-dependent protease
MFPFCFFGFSKKSDFFEYYLSKQIKFSTFVVSATSISELKNKLLNGNGPKDPNGVYRYAVTRWSIKWSWPLKEEHVADYSGATVKHSVEVIIPNWEVTHVDSSELNQWQSLYLKLLNHELDHARNALKTASLVKYRLLKLNDSGINNPDIGNSIARKLVAQNQTWDREYDSLTDHGKSQGIY